MTWYQIVLEYLKVLITWPLLGTLGLLIVALMFRHQLREFIDRLQHIRTPGGFEAETQQTPVPALTTEETPAASEELQGKLSTLQSELAHNESEKQHIVQMAIAAITKAEELARHWEFSYLDLFLVQHTKQVFAFLAGSPSSVEADRLAQLAAMMSLPPAEFGAITNALKTTELISEADNRYMVTEKGKAFMAFMSQRRILPLGSSLFGQFGRPAK